MSAARPAHCTAVLLTALQYCSLHCSTAHPSPAHLVRLGAPQLGGVVAGRQQRGHDRGHHPEHGVLQLKIQKRILVTHYLLTATPLGRRAAGWRPPRPCPGSSRCPGSGWPGPSARAAASARRETRGLGSRCWWAACAAGPGAGRHNTCSVLVTTGTAPHLLDLLLSAPAGRPGQDLLVGGAGRRPGS